MSTLEDVLLNAYEGPLEEDLDKPEVKERFRIKDNDQAEWALRKIKKIWEQKAEKQAQAEMEYKRIEIWLWEETENLKREEAFFTGLLQEYHSGILRDDPTRKVISLPAGKCKMRAQPPEFIRENDKFLVFLESRGLAEFVKVRKEPDWAEYKKRVVVVNGTVIDMETGEIVEGVIARERGPAFSVETEGN